MQRVFLSAVLGVALLSSITLPAMATPAYRTVSRDIATQNTVDVQVGQGRSTAIDFSQANEHITYVLLADPSRVVYTANAPIESGQASTLFLRPIEPLEFPGATQTSITNLSVQTVDAAGQQRLYSFNIYHVEQPEAMGIVISPEQPQRPAPEPSPSLDSLDPDTIERGLAVAIEQGYTSADDPIVSAVRKMLSLVRDDRLTLTQAARSTQVPGSVVIALNRLGNQVDRLLTLPSS